MSLPSFPKVDPPIERENAVNQILSSIAMEELGLSHILNAEGEKLQYILGTLPGLSGPSATVGDVLTATESVRSMLETAVQNQLFLKAKMQGALAASPMQGPTGPTGAIIYAQPPATPQAETESKGTPSKSQNQGANPAPWFSFCLAAGTPVRATRSSGQPMPRKAWQRWQSPRGPTRPASETISEGLPFHYVQIWLT